MTEKYFRLDGEIFVFHPDTHAVVRVGPQRIEPLDHPDIRRALRLKAVEITRRQAEEAVPCLERMACQQP